MKQSDLPFVIYIPDFGPIRIKRRDYVHEPDWEKVNQWDDKEAAKDAIGRLRPEDPIRKLRLESAVVMNIVDAMIEYRTLELQRKLLKVETSLTERDKSDIVRER